VLVDLPSLDVRGYSMKHTKGFNMTKTSGFTLLELIIVIGIIGIVAVLFTFLFRDSQTRLKLREAQVTMQKSFEKARGYSRKLTYKYTAAFNLTAQTITFTSTPVGGPTVPTMVGLNKPCPAAPCTNLPSGIEITSMPSTNVIYTAPLGRTDATDKGVELRVNFGGTNRSTYRAILDIVGVTGKVIARAIQ
jgi:prepilin-type N-terminal cleavage/methylation domain-containing protein